MLLAVLAITFLAGIYYQQRKIRELLKSNNELLKDIKENEKSKP